MSETRTSSGSRKRSTLVADQLLVDDRTVVVGLEGELDLWSAPRLKAVLCNQLAAGRTRLVLDLERVPFMDSTALGVMVGVHRRLGEEERLAIAAPTPPLLRILELSGIAAGFPVFASREAALSYVAEADDTAEERPTPPLTADATLMLGIASTAMPFALSAEDQAQRWLRALRNHGESGAILASLGLSEAVVHDPDLDGESESSESVDDDAVDTVTRVAGEIAAQRKAPKLGTTDVLQAVIQVYGATFYRVLSAHGVDPAELRSRTASAEAAPAQS
jgi:anti-anti-sigma factor